MNKKLIIFDCDGVLVDSEYIASRVFSEVLVSYGYQISLEDTIKTFTGVDENDARKLVLEHSNIDMPTTYWKEQQTKLHAAYEIELTSLMQPVLETLDLLSMQKCVASNSSRSHVTSCLNIAGQHKFFTEESIFTSSQVEKPKPAPDLFLFAARQMGYEPKDCIVVEDSKAGTKAAIAAGMDVLIFLGGSHAKYDWYKDQIETFNKPMFTSCDELIEALKLKLHHAN